jgi:hypothetical protein
MGKMLKIFGKKLPQAAYSLVAELALCLGDPILAANWHCAVPYAG